MKRFLMGVALAATMLATAATVTAASPHGSSYGSSHGSSYGNSYGNSRGNSYNSHFSSYRGSEFRSDYHTRFGTRFSHGYYYSGREHNHWTYRSYWSQYGCDCFWCPNTTCWYYWCESRYCYFPVSFASFAPPESFAPTSAAAASASSSSAVVAPTVVTNVIGSSPQVPVGPPADLPPPFPSGGPKASNTSIGSVGTAQPIAQSIPTLPGR